MSNTLKFSQVIKVRSYSDAELAAAGVTLEEGLIYYNTTDGSFKMRQNGDWRDLDVEAVEAHIASTSNPHSVTAAQVGLGDVDNTSDLAKPISTATQGALDLKADDADVLKKDGSVNLTADWDSSAFNITLKAPASANHAARLTDIQAAQAGQFPKAPVDLVATSNITLSTEQTIDGTLTSNNRVLVAGQTDATENGIYVTASGAWTRADDADGAPNGSEIKVGNTTLVLSGSTYASTVFALNATDAVDPAAITPDTEEQGWVIYSRAESIEGQNGITTVGKVVSLADAAENASGIQVSSGNITLNNLGAFDTDDLAVGTTNKFVTAADLVNLSNLSGTNTGDQNALGVDYDNSGTTSGQTAGNVQAAIDEIAQDSDRITFTDSYLSAAGNVTGGDSVDTSIGKLDEAIGDRSDFSSNPNLTNNQVVVDSLKELDVAIGNRSAYSSTNVISNNDSVAVALGKLDAASSDDQTAAEVDYTPSTVTDWLSGDPGNVKTALDYLSGSSENMRFLDSIVLGVTNIDMGSGDVSVDGAIGSLDQAIGDRSGYTNQHNIATTDTVAESLEKLDDAIGDRTDYGTTYPNLSNNQTIEQSLKSLDGPIQKRGSSSSDFLEEEYVHAITLTASQTNSTSATELQFDSANFEGMMVDYKIKEATSNRVRIGQLLVATDGTSVSITDTFTETGDAGVTWTADLNTGIVRLKYTTTANNKTMRCDLKRIKA